MEMLTLLALALIIFGPDKLPAVAKDAARMLRTLRDLAQGARTQLNDELGPDFADFDLRTLNPRTAIRNALLGDEDFTSLNPREALNGLTGLNPRDALNRALRGEDDAAAGSARATGAGQPPVPPAPAERPLAAGERAPYDSDAT
jgi:sec-independent protein translocase protein TatB